MSLNLKQQPLLAKDIMSSQIHTVRPDCDLSDALHTMLTHHVSGIPLVDENQRYIGMFSEKCCMRVLCDSIEDVPEPWKQMPVARDFMATRLMILRPHDDVFDAIAKLLKRCFSGAPIGDNDKSFIGVFSEKTSMSVVVEAAYSSIPTSAVWAFANPDRDRIIDENADFISVAKIFTNTPYRRLPVIKANKIIGQVSRRDVLGHGNILPQLLKHRSKANRCAMQVHEVADMAAETIPPDMDLLGIAQRFLNTPYRRFPVLDGERLIGQVSRRDVLSAALKLLAPKTVHLHGGLYLSAVDDTNSSRV